MGIVAGVIAYGLAYREILRSTDALENKLDEVAEQIPDQSVTKRYFADPIESAEEQAVISMEDALHDEGVRRWNDVVRGFRRGTMRAWARFTLATQPDDEATH
mmetsp:Transcript_47/g.131  ORF Transcript_47/g.131 Transcript_47/m.131 type:complete len:103 (-) Transcript_47:70-378(-)